MGPIDRTLAGTYTESNGNEEYSAFPENPGLEPHHQMQVRIISKTLALFNP